MDKIQIFSKKLICYKENLKVKIYNLKIVMLILLILPVLVGFDKKGSEKGMAIPNIKGTKVVLAKQVITYSDNRPFAKYRLNATDYGVVYKHGNGPESCDYLGARDVWVWKYKDTYYMHYDGAGPKGWLACLAVSKDLIHWIPKGPVLHLGKKGTKDCASASYGTVYQDGNKWFMYYLGTPHTTPAPYYVPAFPYLTMEAESNSPTGPWVKHYNIIPFKPKPDTYYSATASPGFIIKQGPQYLMFFSASTGMPKILRTISIARTKNLHSSWILDNKPIVPPDEQVENTSIYYEKTNKTYFLFTNHIGISNGLEYTDAIWVYWSKDLFNWDPENKAVVLDSSNCNWSKHIIGLPSVVQVGDSLAIFYDGNKSPKLPQGVKSHMKRDIGLAWLKLPLIPPDKLERK